MMKTEEKLPKGSEILCEEYLLSQEQKENNLRIVEFTFCVSNELVGAERKESS